jgi:hypothetical protein
MDWLVGLEHDQFPLTPALSLGEREPRRSPLAESGRVGPANARAMILPLPKGEGRGEGEQRHQTVTVIPTASGTRPTDHRS